MKAETVDALVAHIRSIAAEIATLQSTVAAETLPPSQQQYLSRCFDLLHMELTALDSYIRDLR